jgi:hypothetical protein
MNLGNIRAFPTEKSPGKVVVFMLKIRAAGRVAGVLLLAVLAGVSPVQANDGADAMAAMPGMADHDSQRNDFVLFLSAEAHHFTAPQPDEDLDEDTLALADALLVINRDRFRLLGEFQLGEEEHDLERFQVGFEPVADTVIWLGRFHQPGSAWNTEHHHGRYLQTAITRPSVELWEDEEGIIPQHIFGVLLDSRRPVGDKGGLQLSAGAGVGNTLTDDGLDPVNLLDPHLGSRHLSLTGRIAWLPDYVGTTSFGLLVSHSDLPVLTPSTAALLRGNRVEQDVYGGFAYWNSENLHAIAAVYDLQMNISGLMGSHAESFLAGYVQVERQLPHQLTVYGREENSSRAGDSLYIQLDHNDFELRRASVGLRWDFLRHQALTLETAHGQIIREREFEYRLQWSAALPW